MIRRRVGDEFFLITQHDHALLAGELAAHVGNELFERPGDRRESFLLAVAQHDCGWPLHDDLPTLNKDGLPLDVFESPRYIALKVWQASVDRMLARGDDYATLLVSLHVLALSAYTMSTDLNGFDVTQSRARFEINRFQHKQIEIQEMLRRKLGLPVDVAMQQGLIPDSHDAGELLLQFHFRLLQAMDLISLGLCCTEVPVKQLRPAPVSPGGKCVVLNLASQNPSQNPRQNPAILGISPWPFEREILNCAIRFRRLPAGVRSDQEAFRKEFAAGATEQLTLQIRPG